tara:strand:- start:303 stop:425 length:123 start_codon:yes stop_codon:yes gene_type:complete
MGFVKPIISVASLPAATAVPMMHEEMHHRTQQEKEEGQNT